MHKERMKRSGTLKARDYRRGGKPVLAANGYLRIYRPGHPLAQRDGMVPVHRMVAWDAGILTDRSDHVHHINGNKTDNRPRNLTAMGKSEHHRLHGMAAPQSGRAVGSVM